MTISTDIQTYVIDSNNLMFREFAEKLIESIEKFKSTTVYIDFIHVNTVSRSFAHQYLKSRNASKKNIKEINVNLNVKKMFNLVGDSIKK